MCSPDVWCSCRLRGTERRGSRLVAWRRELCACGTCGVVKLFSAVGAQAVFPRTAVKSWDALRSRQGFPEGRHNMIYWQPQRCIRPESCTVHDAWACCREFWPACFRCCSNVRPYGGVKVSRIWTELHRALPQRFGMLPPPRDGQKEWEKLWNAWPKQWSQDRQAGGGRCGALA